MNPQAKAIIRWVPNDRGGRTRPPEPSAGYAAPSRWESDPTWERGMWSLWIVHATPVHGNEAVAAWVSFMVEEAPHDMLREGERFELMEGRSVVAKGVVLGEAVQVPPEISEFELALLG